MKSKLIRLRKKDKTIEAPMRKSLFLLTLFSVMLTAQAQNSHTFSREQWLPTQLNNQQNATQLNAKVTKEAAFTIDIALLAQLTINNQSFLIDLPLPDGKFTQFKLISSAVMSEELAEKYPSINTFSGFQVDNPNNFGRFDITPHGFHGTFNYGNNKVFIEPVTRNNDKLYQSYYKKDALPLTEKVSGRRGLPRKKESAQFSLNKSARKLLRSNTNELITYKIAIAATGEYSQFHGGNKEKSLAAIVTLVNRINEVYSRDLAIQFQLVANNDAIIFLDSSSDPFENTDEDIDLIGEVINGAIGDNNYDIGHLVGTGGGGLAGFAVVCSTFKAEGVTGSSNPTADSFHIDYVAHEIGHQFGAEHTFNGSQDACEGNRVNTSAYEPGSASTIMGYAGICAGQNLQNGSNPYFHIHSIDQIQAFKDQLNASCGLKQPLKNTAPSVDAGADFTIPARTPFTLTGQATDIDNDVLSYSWEQFDLGSITTNKTEDATDDGSRPLFKALTPQVLATRTLPNLSDILANKTTYGESLPTTSRELNFRMVVRDKQGNVSDDGIKITVVENQQGFSIDQPSDWLSSKQLVSWHTASTELAPINCSRVSVKLSTDSGLNFDTTLAESIINDGSEELAIPQLSTENARLKLICDNNIFFAINNADFQIDTQNQFNIPPTAVDDKVTITQDQLTSINVLSNDISANGSALIIQSFDYSGTGEISIIDNKISYSPRSGFFGQEQVTYTIVDNNGEVATAILTITVEAKSTVIVSQSSSGGSFYYLLLLLIPVVFNIKVNREKS